MRVFVTGASGWIGRHVVPELLGAGHQVVGLARSDASAALVTGLGAEVLRGDLDDLDTLRAGASAADGVIHLAYIHDFTDMAAAVRADARAAETMGAALAGTDKPLVTASGTPGIPGQVTTEADWSGAGTLISGRETNARAVLALAGAGVRSSIVRLPRSVHGDGDHGFIPALIGMARTSGVAGIVGDGAARWPAAHVKDTAHLFRLALEQAPPASILHAIGDEGVPGLDIATTIGRHLGLPVTPVPPESLGFLGTLLSIDQPSAAPATRELLNWHPIHPGLIEDLDKGHYFN